MFNAALAGFFLPKQISFFLSRRPSSTAQRYEINRFDLDYSYTSSSNSFARKYLDEFSLKIIVSVITSIFTDSCEAIQTLMLCRKSWRKTWCTRSEINFRRLSQGLPSLRRHGKSHIQDMSRVKRTDSWGFCCREAAESCERSSLTPTNSSNFFLSI